MDGKASSSSSTTTAPSKSDGESEDEQFQGLEGLDLAAAHLRVSSQGARKAAGKAGVSAGAWTIDTPCIQTAGAAVLAWQRDKYGCGDDFIHPGYLATWPLRANPLGYGGKPVKGSTQLKYLDHAIFYYKAQMETRDGKAFMEEHGYSIIIEEKHPEIRTAKQTLSDKQSTKRKTAQIGTALEGAYSRPGEMDPVYDYLEARGDFESFVIRALLTHGIAICHRGSEARGHVCPELNLTNRSERSGTFPSPLLLFRTIMTVILTQLRHKFYIDDGAPPVYVVTMQLRNSKTLNSQRAADDHQTGMVRHRHVNNCAVSDLATTLCWRGAHGDGTAASAEEIFPLADPAQLRVLVIYPKNAMPADETEMMSYGHHRSGLRRVFKECKMDPLAVTHLTRYICQRAAEDGRVPAADIDRHGGWNKGGNGRGKKNKRGQMAATYGSGIVPTAMFALGGMPSDTKFHSYEATYVPRALLKVPDALMKMAMDTLFPNVEVYIKAHENDSAKRTKEFKESTRFVKVLTYLVEVMLQDAPWRRRVKSPPGFYARTSSLKRRSTSTLRRATRSRS